jgi:hypothetical protein
VRSHNVGDYPLRYVWTAHNQWDIDIFFVSTFLAGLQTVLADVISVIAGVEDIGILKDTMLNQSGDDTINNLIDGLKGSQTITVKAIIEVNVRLVLLR